MDERRKRIAAALTLFLKMYTTVSSFLLLMASTVSRPRINRRYSLDFYEKREYVRRIVYDNDESCISLWDSYISTHKEAAQFRRKSFPFYHEFSSIYAKDRAIRRDTQTGEDIIEEMTNEESIGGINLASEDEDVGDEDMPDLNFRFIQAQSSSDNRARSEANSDSLSSGGRRKRKISDRDEPITSQSFHNAAMMLSETLVMVGDKLSKSIGTELTLQEKVQQLDKELIQIDGLSNEEYLMALIKLPDRPNQMLVFFSLPPERRLEWVRAFLATS